MAQSQEFHLKERKHISNAASRSSLGPGFSFVDEDASAGLHGAPHINRTRSAHDTAGPIAAAEGPAAHAAMQGTSMQGTSVQSSMQSTYQAMISGNDGQPMKRTGKKTFANPSSLGSTGGSGGASFFGGGTPGWTQPLRPRDESQLGTTKASGQVPGYTGGWIGVGGWGAGLRATQI